MRLSEHFGIPRDELLSRMSADELTDWAAYERIEGPLGSRRSDAQAALIASYVVNVNKGKGEKPAKPADLMPKWDQQRRKGNSLSQWARAVNASQGET